MSLDIHLEAIELLFGLGISHAKQWPGIHILCNHLERKFESLLCEEFEIIWKILKREKPSNAVHGWHWFLAVLRGIQSLQADETVSMEKIYHHLIKGNSAGFSPLEKDHTLLAIFAVLCWASMTIDPDLELGQANEASGNDRTLFLRAKYGSRPGESGEIPLGQSARRPIKKLFRAIKGTLEDTRHDGATATDILYESSVNCYSLYTIGRVRVKWVENLASHLAFDRQSRTLSVFCLPTFCASSILQTQQLNVLYQ